MRRLFLLLFLGSTLLASCSTTAATPTPTRTVAPPTQPVNVVTPPPELSSAAQQPTQQPQRGGVADHTLGPDNAYLTITMYGDFQCAPCIDVARSLAVLRERYPDDVRVVWRHFPQKENDKARLAAQASEAAGAQGKFWEMHDQLFVAQPEWRSLSPAQFRAKLGDYAKLIGVPDLAAFNMALDQQTYGPLIEQAVQEALALDFKGAPVLLFNGLPYSGRVDEYGLDAHTRLRLLSKRWYPHQPDLQIDKSKHYTATLVTEKGNIVIELYPMAAPVTVNNFVALARDGWYNNITFHRVIPGQLAQTGDPSGTGFGTAGYNIIDESENGLSFDREGVVAMASQRGVPNSGSCQFFITYGPLLPASDYDKQFTIFGQVTQGMDVLRKLTPRDPFDELRYPSPPPGDKLISVQISESQ
jgi:cyclophilin family peptidyl-prolyl cis-trans isomerase/protein-disulfide isomerase